MNNSTHPAIVKELKALRKEVTYIKATMLTKKEAKNFATKDDLKNFATKDDLKNFAMKDDLKNFATKDDLKNFATKDDLKNFPTKSEFRTELKAELNDALKGFVTNEKFDRLVIEVLKNGRDIAELKEMKVMLTEMRDELRLHSNRMDAYAKEARIIDHNDEIHRAWFRELKDAALNHETRISALESGAS